MAGTTTLRVPRSRGAFSGALLILLGIWGALVPMIGPYLHYAYTPDRAWDVTSGRVWLEFLPAAGAIIGGFLMMSSRFRPAALTGSVLAGLSGIWFLFGTSVMHLWMHDATAAGTPAGGSFQRAIEHFGFFTGLGVVIIGVAVAALGRLSVVTARDLRLAEREAARTAAEPAIAEPVPSRKAPVPASSPSEPVSAPARRSRFATLTRVASRNENKDDEKVGSGAASS
jgi:hypothetical protein